MGGKVGRVVSVFSVIFCSEMDGILPAVPFLYIVVQYNSGVALLLLAGPCILMCFSVQRETPLGLEQALMTEPDNVKALYRRAVVYRLRDQFK